MGEGMIKRTRLIIVRHAEAEGNANRLFHGWTDSSITKKGHIQAMQVAERLKAMDMDLIYSSTLRRTMQTADYIAKAKGLPIMRTDKLKEINGGDWEDLPWSVLPEKWPDEYDLWENKPHIHQMPNGESMKEFQTRIIDEFWHIINNNKSKDICIVTHGTAIKSLMCFFYHYSLEEMVNFPWYDNTAITIIDYKDDKFNIVMEGDTSHLSKEMKTLENQEWWLEKKCQAKEREREDIGYNE